MSGPHELFQYSMDQYGSVWYSELPGHAVQLAILLGWALAVTNAWAQAKVEESRRKSKKVEESRKRCPDESKKKPATGISWCILIYIYIYELYIQYILLILLGFSISNRCLPCSSRRCLKSSSRLPWQRGQCNKAAQIKTTKTQKKNPLLHPTARALLLEALE